MNCPISLTIMAGAELQSDGNTGRPVGEFELLTGGRGKERTGIAADSHPAVTPEATGVERL